jgi:hypothetical protein
MSNRRADGKHTGVQQLMLPPVHEFHAVAALSFGLVERLVRELEGAYGTAVRRRPERRDADADGDSRKRPGGSVLDVQLAHDGTDPVRDLPGLLVVDVIKDDRELLAAVACQDIQGPTDYFLNSLGDLAQGEIAGLVSVKVVVGFEVIDVDQ